MNRPVSLLLILISALLTACQTSHVVVGTQRAPISPEEVVLYSSPPRAPYVEVALISTDSSFSLSLGGKSKMNVVIRRLKKDAAKLGANGLIITGLGEKHVGNLGSGSFNGTATHYGNQTQIQGTTSSTTVFMFEKQGEALAIYVAPEDKQIASLNNMARFLGLTISQVENQMGKGERIAAASMGISVSTGEEEPVVLIYDREASDRTMTFVFFRQRLEGAVAALDQTPLTLDEALRMLDLFTDNSSWIKAEPAKPEIDLQWNRADGAYYAIAMLEKGVFIVGNSELMPAN